MAQTTDLAELGAEQSAFFALLREGYPLPANAALFPLGSAQYFGQVATNCRLANAKAGSNKGLSARNHHRARGAVTEIAMVLPNWYVERSGAKFEYPNVAGSIVGASVEYPAGTFHRLKFDDAVRGLVPGGSYLVSDFLALNIPDGAEFWTNIWVSAGATVIFYNGATGQVAGNGERANVGTGELPDYTLAPHTGTAQSFGFWPLALLGRTRGKATAIFGDSLGEGVGDSADASDHVGMIARALGNHHGYVNLSQSGDRLQLALQSHSKRLSVLAYVRNAVSSLGLNDIGSGRSLVQVQSDMLAFWRILASRMPAGGRVFQTTITPSTTSTDSFATLANQAPSPGFVLSGAGTRERLNDWLRDGAPIVTGVSAAPGAAAIRAGEDGHPLSAVFDVADQVESARNSGRWKVDGTAGKWTTDGIHPSTYGYAAISSSGVVDLFSLV
ncbi:Lysophospholipase L1 [Devosia crocina]|uniref:Lysophospholipase L1 n=1 Tax=Devosia crocina TaxID=429728 RepID=A0A1I7N1M3_9HYPH|nr:SGNH/GDSL hydrolase family protein [Devosia crocina]SFV28535.1 Lysophospholipase L1 [Devosia crocina]